MKELAKAFLEDRNYEYGPYRVAKFWDGPTKLSIIGSKYVRMLEKHHDIIIVFRAYEDDTNKLVSEFIQALGPNYDHNMESYVAGRFTPIKMIKASQQLKLF